MNDLDLTAAIEAAEEAARSTADEVGLRDWNSEVERIGAAAVKAAAPLIEKAIAEQWESRDLDGIVNGVWFSAALKARERRIRGIIAAKLQKRADACYDDPMGASGRGAYLDAAAIAKADQPTPAVVPAGQHETEEL